MFLICIVEHTFFRPAWDFLYHFHCSPKGMHMCNSWRNYKKRTQRTIYKLGLNSTKKTIAIIIYTIIILCHTIIILCHYNFASIFCLLQVLASLSLFL